MRRMLRLIPALLLVGTALVAVGCGDDTETASSITSKSSDERATTTDKDDDDDDGSSTTTTTTKKATTTVPTSKKPKLTLPPLRSTTTIVTTTVPGATIPPVTRRVSELTGFTSPSENIGCYIDPGFVRCDIMERAWDPPPPPDWCDLDYGQGIEMEPGGFADFVCAGDTALYGGGPLPYGQSIGAGVLRCDSAESGMTCVDTSTGNGFSMAIEGYSLF